MTKNTFYINLKDENEEIENEIIVVKTNRTIERIEEIINNAIETFNKGNVRECGGVWEYIFYTLDKHNIKWENFEVDATIYY